jgi:hypothetical protein
VCGEQSRQLGNALGVEPLENACDAATPRGGIFRRDRSRDRIVNEVVREDVFEDSASTGFADDAPVEKLVERIGERGLIPRADLADRVAREALPNARGDLRGSSRVLGEPRDAALDGGL